MSVCTLSERQHSLISSASLVTTSVSWLPCSSPSLYSLPIQQLQPFSAPLVMCQSQMLNPNKGLQGPTRSGPCFLSDFLPYHSRSGTHLQFCWTLCSSWICQPGRCLMDFAPASPFDWKLLTHIYLSNFLTSVRLLLSSHLLSEVCPGYLILYCWWTHLFHAPLPHTPFPGRPAIFLIPFILAWLVSSLQHLSPNRLCYLPLCSCLLSLSPP